jgi:hypothetical protein
MMCTCWMCLTCRLQDERLVGVKQIKCLVFMSLLEHVRESCNSIIVSSVGVSSGHGNYISIPVIVSYYNVS